MIAFVKGVFLHKTPSRVVVDVNGVGYDLQISSHTYACINNIENGLLYVYLHITETAHTLYGFADTGEKELFLLLASVSGVSANTARMMLSSMQPEEIIRAITQRDSIALERIKGIGKKTAERLVLELRDKLSKQPIEILDVALSAVAHTPISDAITALVALGIARVAAENAVRKVAAGNPTLVLEELIKLSLKNI